MATSSLPLSITVTAQTAQAARSIGALQSQLQGLSTSGSTGGASPFSGLVSGAGAARSALGPVLALVTAIAGAAAGMGAALSKGFSVNSEAEDTTLGIKGMLAAMYAVRDASGNIAEGPQALAIASGEAEKQMQALRIAGLQTKATFTELSASFQAALSAGATAGFNPDQVRVLTVGLTQAAGAMGLAADQMKSEINALFTGDINADADLSKRLGISREDVAQWKAAGATEFYDQLNKRLEVYKLLGDEAAGTWSGVLSNAADAADLFFGKMTVDAFATMKEGLKNALSGVFDMDTGDISDSLEGLVEVGSRVFNGIATLASDALAGAVDMAQELSGWFDRHSDTVDGLFEGISAVYDTLKAVVSAAFEGVGAFNGVSSAVDLIGVGLKVVAFILASLADGIRVVGAAFAYIGGIIADAIGRPLARVLGSLQSFLAKIPGIGASLATAVGAIVRAIPQNGNSLRSYAQGVAKDFTSGKSAVQSLNKELSKTTQQRREEKAEFDREARRGTKPTGTITAKAGGTGGGGTGGKSKAASDAAKAAKELADAQRTFDLAEIDAARKKAADIRAVQEAELKQKLDSHKISQLAYLQQVTQAHLAEFEAERSAIARKKALIEQDLAATKDPAKAKKLQAELVKLNADLDALEQKRVVVGVKLQADVDQFQREVSALEVDIRANILDASGNPLGASLLRLQKDTEALLEDSRVKGDADMEALVRNQAELQRAKLQSEDRAARAQTRASLKVAVLTAEGKPLESELARIKQEFSEDMSNQHVKDDPYLQALAERKYALAEQAAMANENVRLAEQHASTLAALESGVQRMVERGQLTTRQGEEAVRAARIATAESVLEQVKALEKLYETTKNPAVLKALAEQRQAYEDVAAAANRDSGAEAINSEYVGALRQTVQLMREGKSAAEALRTSFSNAFANLATGVADEFFKDMLNGMNGAPGQSLGGALSRALSGGLDGFGTALQSVLSGAGDWFSSLLSGLGGGGGGFLSMLGGMVGFASGGYTGPGGKYQPAGIVHRNEFVFTSEEVNALGLPFLMGLRKRRFAALPGYANGGLVGGGMQGALASAMGSVQMSGTSNVALHLDGREIARSVVKQSLFEDGVKKVKATNASFYSR